MVEVLRVVLAEHGYSAKPDLALIQKVGECVAYHELAGAIHDKYHMGSLPIRLDDLFAAKNEFDKLNDAVWGPE
jgi:hypothetical protein